jgi:ketosteroid isomerase-like protein
VRELLVRSYAAYSGGQRGFLLDLFDDNIEWVYYGAPEALPVPNRIRGKMQVIAALKAIDAVFEDVRSELQDIVADEDRAAIILNRTVRQRSTGRVITYKVAAFHAFRHGRMVKHTAFIDSIDMLQQVLGRELVLPQGFSAQTI